MRRLCYLTLTSAVLVMSRVKPEPPETNFFLVSIPLKTGLQSSVVFFTNSYSKKPEPLCLNDDVQTSSNKNLLAHKLCTDSKFSTFLQTSLVKPSSVLGYSSDETSSALSCYQDNYYDIVCNRSTSSHGSCSLLHVACGACHHHVNLQPNSSLQLVSPLYPVLQPGLVCQYDLQLPQGVSADISIEIADLSLAPAEVSQSGKHCVNSFLHILSGETFISLESVASLCGEVYFPEGSSFFRLKNSVVRLLLVSGSEDMAFGRRGFLVNVQISSSSAQIPLTKLVMLLSFFGLLIIIVLVLASVILYLNRKSKARISHPRRRQTWHGSVARPGESLHQTRTERIRQLGNWSRSSWGSDNLYMFDNRVSRRLPQLPAFNFASDNQNHQGEGEDPGFKVYETISLKSKSSESILDEALANTEKKFSTNSSNQCPPPLPSRPIQVTEDPYSSPLYLSLPGCYTDAWSHNMENGDTMSAHNDEGTDALATNQVVGCAEDQRTPDGRLKVTRNGLSGLMDRIRSISLTECGEDEANLLESTTEEGESKEMF